MEWKNKDKKYESGTAGEIENSAVVVEKEDGRNKGESKRKSEREHSGQKEGKEYKGKDRRADKEKEKNLGQDDEVTTDVPAQPTILWDDTFTNLSIGCLLSEISLQENIKDSELNFINKCSMQPIGLLSDISVGGLLSEASLQAKISNSGVKLETESIL